jgi:hypothetical protein
MTHALYSTVMAHAPPGLRPPWDPGRPRGSGQPGARPQREANTRVPAELEFSGAGRPRGGFKKL